MITLLEAVTKPNNNVTVSRLLQNGENVNQRDEMRRTPLILAALFNNYTYVEKLLLFGADPFLQSKSGTTALIAAAQFGHTKCVEILVKNCNDRSHLNIQDKLGQTALIYSAKENHYDILKFLIETGADIETKDRDNYTALAFALLFKSYESVNLLLKIDSCKADYYISKNTGLLSLAIKGNVCKDIDPFGGNKFVKSLLQRHAPANTPDIEKYLFTVVARSNFLEYSYLFIKEGCSPVEHRCRDTFFPFSIYHPISPLAVAVLSKKIHVAYYFLLVKFLTFYDVKKLSFDPDVRRELENKQYKKGSEFLRCVFGTPWKLSTLSFVVVSSCLGGGVARKSRVENSGLPPILQRQLLFRSFDLNDKIPIIKQLLAGNRDEKIWPLL